MHLCTNEWQGFSVLPLLAQIIVSISKEQYWPLSGTFNSLVPKSLLGLEEFTRSAAGCSSFSPSLVLQLLHQWNQLSFPHTLKVGMSFESWGTFYASFFCAILSRNVAQPHLKCNSRTHTPYCILIPDHLEAFEPTHVGRQSFQSCA